MWPKRTTPAAGAPWRKGWQPWALAVFFCLRGCISSLWADYADWDFEQILRNADKKYGNLDRLTHDKIIDWQTLINDSQALDEPDKLQAVNSFFNHQFRFVDDLQNWQENDYWATPLEASIKGAADCEDYSIAKYFTLRRLGIPSEKLRITYVKALEYNQAHMVLTYYATPTSDPLVLDNLIPEIRPASQRRDLLPVYAFNAEGLYLPGKKSGDSRKCLRKDSFELKVKGSDLKRNSLD